jgi:drug/metabolite transporter (DMT)-like permease
VVPSGMAAVLYATMPLTSAFLTRAFGMEALTVPKLVGAATAFAGVAILFSSTLRGDVASWGLLAIFVAATVATLGSVLLKRGPRQDPLAANAAGSAIGALMAGAATLALGEPHPLPTSAATLGPLIYLVVAGSMGAFVIMSWLVHHWPVTRTSYVSVVVPVLALGLGHAVRHERLTLINLAGVLLVLAGLVIGMRHTAARPVAATAERARGQSSVR